MPSLPKTNQTAPLHSYGYALSRFACFDQRSSFSAFINYLGLDSGTILSEMREIVLIAHDIRSAHNVGSLLRTADGLGIQHVYFTGYTPYPQHKRDTRLPHIAAKLHNQIKKTALGAEANNAMWSHHENILAVVQSLRNEKYSIVALEQAKASIKLPRYRPGEKIAILLGREVEGIEPELLKLCDDVIEIPMFGGKESYNVVEAATMAMYHCRFAK